MSKELEQEIYMKGYIDGMHGFDPELEADFGVENYDELFDIYTRLRAFSYSECNELTDSQRNILNAILDEFDYILQMVESHAEQ